MRVTNRAVSRNYLRGLNNTLKKVADTQERIGSQMKFQNLSDNVASGSRAMRFGQQLDSVERHLQNITDVKGELESSENIITDLKDIIDSVHTKVLKALNPSNSSSTTTNEENRKAIASEIANLKSQVLQFCNAQFGGKYLFSGTNNSTVPFTLDNNGKVLFNGTPVDDIYKKTDGNFYYKDNNNNEIQVPQSEDTYIDVGLGIKVTAGNIDPATAFKVSFSGLDVLGIGTTASKTGKAMSNNIFNLLDQVETALKDGDTDFAGELNDHISDRTSALLTNLTDIGNRTEFLERTESRLTDEKNTLGAMCSDLISINEGEEAINLSTNQRVLQATLQYGSQILPMSLMDFIS